MRRRCAPRVARRWRPDTKGRQVSAHNSFELERAAMGLHIAAHKHSPVRCCLPLRARDRRLSRYGAAFRGRRPQAEPANERALPWSARCWHPSSGAVASLAALRQKIRGFLLDWLGLEPGVATINRCIHAFGLASAPVVEELVQEVRAAGIVHLDATPWYQAGNFLWLWGAVRVSTVVLRIASRRKEELVALIGEAFLGWLVTDGDAAWRDHPRRQRCLAHLIRKALALADGYYGEGSGFGGKLVRDFRRLIERVKEGSQDVAVKRLLARIAWTCRRNRYENENKVRDLAREILNDWEAVIAFVSDLSLPPTNNDAERALRHAVIARRISFATRTDEGSRFDAAALSVIETCGKRRVDPWAYACDLITAARENAPLPQIPALAA